MPYLWLKFIFKSLTMNGVNTLIQTIVSGGWSKRHPDVPGLPSQAFLLILIRQLKPEVDVGQAQERHLVLEVTWLIGDVIAAQNVDCRTVVRRFLKVVVRRCWHRSFASKFEIGVRPFQRFRHSRPKVCAPWKWNLEKRFCANLRYSTDIERHDWYWYLFLNY